MVESIVVTVVVMKQIDEELGKILDANGISMTSEEWRKSRAIFNDVGYKYYHISMYNHCYYYLLLLLLPTITITIIIIIIIISHHSKFYYFII